MDCSTIERAMNRISGCLGEAEGGFRYRTHCLYPSFNSVEVFVSKLGDGFHVHDGGGAFREAWLHGRDEKLISNCLKHEAQRHRLKLIDDVLSTDVLSLEWLPSAILAVANSSGRAAADAAEKIRISSEAKFIARIGDVLKENFGRTNSIKHAFKMNGKSGKEYVFDYCIGSHSDNIIIIDAISPHHVSVSSKYMAFSDTIGFGVKKLAVYEKPLPADDASLIQQVANIIPFASLAEGSRRILNVK